MKLSLKLTKDITRFKKINLILSGGRSPIKEYESLFKKKLNWENVSLFLLDDRLVRINDKRSNFYNINKILEKNNLHNKLRPINKYYLNKTKISYISKKLQKKKTITVLGMGNDGHYASIFRESKKYKLLTNVSNKPSIYRVEPLGKPKVARVTMNLSMILLSSKIYLILNNKTKKNLYKRAKDFKDCDRYSICSLIQNCKKIIID